MIDFKKIPASGKTLNAIIFDLGGVLLNLDFKKSFLAFKKLGFKEIEQEMSRLLYSLPAGNDESLFHLYEKGLIDSDQFRDALRELAAGQVTDDEINRAWTAMLLDIHEENVSILEKIRGSYRIFLLSNTNAIHIESLHRRKDYPGIASMFEKVYYSHELKMRKPDPEIFEHVIKDAGLSPGNSLFIDDSIHNVEAARNVGLQTFHHKANTSLATLFL